MCTKTIIFTEENFENNFFNVFQFSRENNFHFQLVNAKFFSFMFHTIFF